MNMKTSLCLLALVCAATQAQQALVGTFQPASCDNAPCPSVRWTVAESGTSARFTITGSGSSWTSVSFSDTNRMPGGVLVYDCIDNTPSAIIQTSTNVGNSGNNPTPQNDNQLSNLEATSANGVVECNFDAPVGSSPQYILLARGSIGNNNVKNPHNPSNRWVSSSQVVPNRPENITAPGESCKYCRSVHGTFMILAWVLFAGSGIVIARFYKPFLGKVRDTAGWFIIHRLFMILALTLTVIAFIIIFVARDGYSQFGEQLAAAHPVLGILVTLLCIANPIMAMFRCHPGTPNRFIFNYAHWAVGFLAHTLGAICILIAFASPTLRSVAGSADWTASVVYAYVSIHFGFFITMEAIHWFYPADMKSNETEAQPKSSLKIFLFGGYFFAVVALAIALIVGIWDPMDNLSGAASSTQ